MPYAGPYSEDDLLLFGRYEWLYPVMVQGRQCWVPEGNSVLRAFQYLALKSSAVRLPWHTYCWNSRDDCCRIQFRDGTHVREARACATAVRPGLEIVRLPPGGTLCPPTP